jgi:hypothetical protein
LRLDPSGAGIGLQVAYYFYAVVTPFCCLAFLVKLMLMPLKDSVCDHMAEITNAWSAVRSVCSLHLSRALGDSTFASFIIGHRCDIIDAILSKSTTATAIQAAER